MSERTKIIDIKGMIFDSPENAMPCNVTVRYTSDKVGKTISLNAANIMIVVPFEEIEKMIKEVENK